MIPKYIAVLCIMLGLITGCSAGSQYIKQAAKTEVKSTTNDQSPYAYQPPEKSEGSLWSESEGSFLFPDRRARRVGDLVIVRIVEDPEAKLNASTNASRSSGVDASKLEFLGFMKALAEKNSRLAQDPGKDDLMLASLGTKFDGKGSSDRDGHIKAYVSAVVLKVFPNGNMFINGRREIKVNNETEYITLSGIVRAEDISTANEVSSAYVAEAKISYSGKGPVADKQRPGWLMGVIDYVWPF
ncbi:MAG: flagellar basal body L-ring protein FlgH [Proteobacteria bacterium]|nr:flagellar basal body L-ring protein FlgH [Pseudomonadota bacterium]